MSQRAIDLLWWARRAALKCASDTGNYATNRARELAAEIISGAY